MAVRGNQAKINVTNKIKEAFGTAYVGEYDKKIYVWADDGGEQVQIALSMTCPKAPVGSVDTSTLSYNAGRDFGNEDVVAVPPNRVEITEEEKENVRRLMQRMGL